jgi:hypothetical protein
LHTALRIEEQSMRSGPTRIAHRPASTKNNGIASGHGRVRSDGTTATASAIHPNPQIAMKIVKIQGFAAPVRPSSLMYWRT